MNALTDHDSNRLSALELVIKDGRDSFLAVGMALAQINRDRLYRQDYSTFEEYLDKRWSISKSQGYRLIAFAKDVETSPTGDTPKTEHQSRKRREPAMWEAAKVEEVDSIEPTTPHQPIQEASKPAEEVIHEIAAKIEPDVTEYYSRLEQLFLDAIKNASDKQLASMGVYAALLPKLIKDEQKRRAA